MNKEWGRFWFLVYESLFEHRLSIGAAVWVLLWCVARMTKEIHAEDGTFEGPVLGGDAVPLKRIASELGNLSTDAVYEHLLHLTNKGYIRKIPHGNGRPNGYVVVDSRRFTDRSKNRRTKAGGSGDETVVQKPDGFDETVVQKPDGPEQGTLGLLSVDPQAFVSGPSYKSPSVDKEVKTVKTVKTYSSNGRTRPTTPQVLIDDLVKDGFRYFLAATERHADQYRFDDKRRRMGVAGFQALVMFAAGREDPDPPGRAALMFRVAVDRMCASPFHSGDNQTGTRYQDWHQLFSGKGYASPGKLLEFWLDEQRWGGKEKSAPTFEPVSKPVGVVERGGVA